MEPVRLLIADDHQILLEGIASLFREEAGITVAGIAANGEEVLQLAEENDYDVCLLDINMPGLDGIQTARILKQKRPGIKIAILTTYNDKAIVNEIIQEGISGYLLKNSSRQELITAIQKIAAGGIYFSDEIHKIIIEGYSQPKQPAEDEILFTRREMEVLSLLAKEYTNEKIAAELNISYRTVETHRKNMLQKTNAHNLAGLLKYAYGKGLLK